MEYGGGTSVYPQVSITLACSAGDRSRAVRAAAQIEHVRCVDHSSGSPWRYVDTTPVVIEYHKKSYSWAGRRASRTSLSPHSCFVVPAQQAGVRGTLSW